MTRRSEVSKGTYIPKCASDKNPDWPLWYVELDGLNVLKTGSDYGGKFASKAFCEAEAKRLNAEVKGK